MSKRTRERWRRQRAARPPPSDAVPPIADVQGGVGGGSAHAREEPTAADAGLVARASAKSWSVADRAALLDRMREIVNDPARKPRERIAAFRAIVMAERLDLESVKVTMAAADHETLVDELAALEQRLEQASSKSRATSR